MTYYIKNMPAMSVILQNLAFKNGYTWKSGSTKAKVSKCTYMGVDSVSKQIWNSNEKHEGVSLEEGIELLAKKEITLSWDKLKENVIYEVVDSNGYSMEKGVVVKTGVSGVDCFVLRGNCVRFGKWNGQAYKQWTFKRFEGTLTLGAK